MTEGVIASVSELINLRRYTQATAYQAKGKSLHSALRCSQIRGRGMDFAETRNYQAGDEIRHMEWRVTARTGRPHVKIYHEERERPVVIVVDFNPSMIFGTQKAFKSVVAARLASLLAWTVIQQADRVGGFFFSATEHSEFIPRGRDLGVLPLLSSLSRYTEQALEQRTARPRQLSQALMRLRRVIRPGSILILISDFYSMDADCDKHFNRLSGHHDMVAYHICDTLELSPPKPNQYPISNGKQELLLDTTVPGIHTAYAEYCQHHLEQLKNRLKRYNIPYINTTADTDLVLMVRQTFARSLHV